MIPPRPSRSRAWRRLVATIVACVALVGVSAPAMSVPTEAGDVSYAPNYRYDLTSRFAGCHGGAAANLAYAVDTLYQAGSAVSAWCQWGYSGDNWGSGVSTRALEGYAFRNYSDASWAYRIFLRVYPDSAGPGGGSVAMWDGDGSWKIGAYPGGGGNYNWRDINQGWSNPRFSFIQDGAARTYDRYLRFGNSRIWVTDNQGADVWPEPATWGAFHCPSGAFYNFGGNTWCSGMARWTWYYYDNELGRGQNLVFADGNQVWGGDLAPQSAHGWGAGDKGGGWGSPGTGSHSFETAAFGHGFGFDYTGKHWVNVDQTNPTASTWMSATDGVASWSNGPGTVLTTGGATDQGAGVGSYQWWLGFQNTGQALLYAEMGNQAWIPWEGTIHGNTFTIDGVRRTSGWGPGIYVNFDRTAPATPTISQTTPQDVWTNQNVTFTCSGAYDINPGVNAISGISVHQGQVAAIGASTWETAMNGSAYSQVYTEPREGYYAYACRGIDVANNASGYTLGHAKIDKTAPDTAPGLTQTTTAWTNAPVTVSVSTPATDAQPSGVNAVSGVAGYQFRYRTDGGAWGAWTNASSTTIVAEGEHDVQFRAVDGAGNVSGEIASARVLIDLTPPTEPEAGTSAADVLAQWEKSSSAVVVTGPASDDRSGIARYQYQVAQSPTYKESDGTTPVTVHDGDRLTLTPGEWYVRFRAVDVAGNAGPWSDGAATENDETPGPATPPGESGGNPPTTAPPTYSWRVRPGVRYTWGEDPSGAICQLPSAESPGGEGCSVPGGDNWRKKPR